MNKSKRVWYRVVVRISLLGLALAMVFWTMKLLNNPESVENNSFFQIFSSQN